MVTKPPIVSLGSPPVSSEAFKVQTQSPIVRFLNKAVQPPSSVYVESDDEIVFNFASTQLENEQITVNYRLLRFDGEVIHGQFVAIFPADRLVHTHTEPLTEGFLLSMSCKALQATTRGQTFVRAFITNPGLGGNQPSYMLMADYVTQQMAPGYPNGRVTMPSEGPGNITQVTGSTPAAGANWSLQVPANSRWRVITTSAVLFTDAVVGNRVVEEQFVVNLMAGYLAVSASNQPASTSYAYTGAELTPTATARVDRINLPVPPDLILLAANFVNSVVFGMDPGDQWSAPQMIVEEWLDNV